MVAGNKKKMYQENRKVIAVKGFFDPGLLLNDATLNVAVFPVFAYSFDVYKASTYEYEILSFLGR